jgi:hypothetical protein
LNLQIGDPLELHLELLLNAFQQPFDSTEAVYLWLSGVAVAAAGHLRAECGDDRRELPCGSGHGTRIVAAMAHPLFRIGHGPIARSAAIQRAGGMQS